MKKVSLARKTEAKVREIHNECARHIENDNHVALKAFLDKHPDVFVNDIIDSNGKTLLHECTFNDSYKCLKLVIDYGRAQLARDGRSEQLVHWINMKDQGDGFVALHFASFKGNPDACDLLIEAGADLNAINNFGINMLHVAAQGD